MSEILKLKKKIPDKKIGGNNFTANLDTALVITRHAILNFKIDDYSDNSQVLTWLEGLDGFTLQDWLTARSKVATFLATRKVKTLAIRDIVENYDFDKIYLVHPDDLFKIPGLTKQLMSLTPIEQGVALAQKQISNSNLTSSKPKEVQPTPAPRKSSYKTKLVKNLPKNSTTVLGCGTTKIGVDKKTLELYLRLEKGGRIEKVTSLLSSKKSISEIVPTPLTSAQTFESFHLRLKVDLQDIHFWKRETFWPVGAKVSLWKGNFTNRRVNFFKRLEVRNIEKGITGTHVTNFIRRIYPKITFNELVCGEITSGKAVVSMKFERASYCAFMATGLRFSEWPPGVRVRFLKRNFIDTRGNSWLGTGDKEEARFEVKGTLDLQHVDIENLDVPVENVTENGLEGSSSEVDDIPTNEFIAQTRGTGGAK